MRLLNIYFVFLLCVLSASAQSNFKPGYIITNNKDSIEGFIDFKTDKLNFDKCVFKTSEFAEVQTFLPGDIAKYKFVDEGKYYISHEITIDEKPKLVFLEYLVQGTMDLYYYVDYAVEQEYYFFQYPDGKMMSLTKKPNEIVEYRIKTDQKYKGVLNYMFSDYPTLIKDIPRTSFKKKDIIKLTKEYHDLTCDSGEQCIIYENDFEKQFLKTFFSVYGGLQHSEYVSGILQYYGLATSFKSYSPVLGAQLNIFSPRRTKSFSGQVDISLSEIRGREDFAPSYSHYGLFELKALAFSTKAGVKYTYPGNKICPTIEAGLGYLLLLNSSMDYSEEVRFGEVVRSYVTEDYFKGSLGYLGLNVAIGVDYKFKAKDSIFLRLLYDTYTNGDKIKIMQMKIGYSFR